MSMTQLPRREHLPNGVTLEKAARNLASLVMTETIEAMRQIVLSQWKHKDDFANLAKFGIRPVDRLLFFGPPGNGKTLTAGWIAKQFDVPFYRVRCEALINAHLGRTAANIGDVMEWLQSQRRCVVLFDEVEMLFPSRTFATDNCAKELQSAMGVFWQYLDRWEAQTLFILATNMPDRLDPALVSRIDLQMEFGPPTPAQASAVAQYWAETLHEYGGAEWLPAIDDGQRWESFRALFQAVQMHVRQFVAARSER